MANKAPLVSIVILNWNGLDDTKICLEHVYKLDYPNYEVIIVDNGSTQDQKDYLSKLKNVTYVDNVVNRGFAGGQADGYRHANGDYILLLNNDAAIKSNYLQVAMPFFNDPAVAVVGGRSYFWNDDEPLLDESNRFYSYMKINPVSAETDLQLVDAGVTQEVNTVSGSSVLIRRTSIDKVGYLYEPFFAYYEETDLFARIKRAGYKVLYSPDLHIWHRNGASSGAQGGSSFFFYHIFRNRYMYAVRNFESKYLKSFLADYYKKGVSAILDIPNGPVQRRLGASYAKAIGVAIINSLPLYLQRRELTKKLGNREYCQQIVSEQTSISVVVDGTELSKKQIEKTLLALRKSPDPIVEYILVVDANIYSSSSINANVRVVSDRGYFDTHPVNLGCLVARMDWLVVCDSNSLPNASDYQQAISNLRDAKSKVISLHKTNTSIAIEKKYYQKIGGLYEHPTNLSINIKALITYALADNSLFSKTHKTLPSSLTSKKATDRLIAYNNQLERTRHGSRWQVFLARHYRFQQLTSLLSWLLNPKISLHLKLARIKNLALFTATLKRKSLATELRHIRNEAGSYGKEHEAIMIGVDQQKLIKTAHDKATKDVSTMPVFIVCFERVDALRILVQKLEKLGLKRIVFIDNDSSYKPLLDYYDKSPYQVLRLYRNIGHTSPWSLDIIRTLVPNDYYIVTDPDIIPAEECPKDAVKHLLAIHLNYPSYQKVGFGLSIDDLPDHYPLKKEVIAWEGQFWSTELAEGLYEAGIDTTFAVYKPFTYNYMLHPSIRTGYPYSAQHLPWYANPKKTSTEDAYYRLRADSNITSWGINELPDRYKKEMSNE